MKRFNLCLLPNEDRRFIELERQAAFLIVKMRKGKITRVDVNAELNKLNESEQPFFRDMLNKYREMK